MPAQQDSVDRAEQRRQKERAEGHALHRTQNSEVGKDTPAEIVAMTGIWHNTKDPATMRVAVRWKGWSNNRRFSTPADRNGLTWQLLREFTGKNGKLKDARQLFADFLELHNKSMYGKRYPFDNGFRKKDAQFVATRPGYAWIKMHESLKWPMNTKK